MARKQEKQEDWISSREAAAILTKNSGHEVTTDYVRQLGRHGKISTKELDGRTKLYSRADAEGYTVKKRGDGDVRRIARAPQARKEKAVA